ncbi:hypothetical protein WHR41_01346 [Cladosporium halotolerans]|uniref:TATA-binding protein interacting (TIP20) domain-containing protein n=1 Tax=Cladosporium halotolerans TaxID=1052096 RepID=A0AB34L4W6_9PEZI
MSSSAGVPPNPTSHHVASLLPKLNDPDPDIRYMTLNDLHSMLDIGSPSFLLHDYTTCARVVDGLIHTLNDGNGDVQNMAINCLGPFVNKAPENILCPTIEKVSSIKTDNTIDTTVPALAVRAIVVALPHPVPGGPRGGKVQESYNAVSKALIPRLVGKVLVPIPGGKNMPPPPKGMLQEDLEKASDSNSLDLLAEVAKCFGPMLQEVEVQALEQIAMQILENDRCGSVMKKKAVAALAALGPYFSDGLLSNHVSYTIEQLRQPHLTNQQRKIYLTVYGSMAKAVPKKFGPYLKTLAPFVLSPLSQEELDQQREQEADADGERDTEIEEVREAALVAIENFLLACAQDLKAHLSDVTQAALRFLKYDPTLADDDDEEMEEQEDDDEFEAEENFEEETGFDDEDDVSWKVRRCSAKVLHAMIATINPPFVDLVAPALIARFKEREESVRNEVLTTLAFLISKNGPTNLPKSSGAEANGLPQNRKRRRGGSDAVLSDLHAQRIMMNGYASPSSPPPMDKAGEQLAKLNPQVVKEAAKLLKSSTPQTKLAVMSLLKAMVAVQRGGLSDHADLVIEPVVDTMKSAAGIPSGNALRIEALALLRVIGENHSSKILQAHLSKVVPALVVAAKDRYAKVSTEAFSTIEVFVKALTPPRSAATKSQNGEFLGQLYTIITDRITAQDSDTEVRQKAVQALGLLVGRASGSTGSSLLSEQDRFAGQDLIAERMKNELTRLASVRAVDTIAVLAQNSQDFKPGFVSTVSLELAAQLRKSSRSLRGASLSALRMLAANEASRQSLDDGTISQIIEMLLPLIQPDDLHMLGPALAIFGSFAKENSPLVTTPAAIGAICKVTSASLHGNALEALVTCVESIGQAGAGKDLMSALLNQGVQADTDVSGRVIGTLLVSSGGNVGVQLEDFVKELKSQSDEGKKCLALSVLGETGLRQGTECSLKPENFTPYFEEQSEKVKLAAAVALGRAGAGNVKVYLPQILDAMDKGRQYLLLHSVKELLQHSAAEEDIRPYTATLWEHIISSGQAEDNKVVSAECIGRLATIDPAAYLPQLQTFLQNSNPTVRGMVITALRYIFSDTDDSYNNYLRPTIIQMLTTMLADADLENQRLSLSAFNSAFHNKPDLVMPHLSELLPYAMQATVVRPDLVREVAMGPFKHKVDDGLEIRKSAFETLYALLDEPASRQRLDLPSFYDRIIAGVADEHEIKILCCLVLGKLLIIAPSESARRLEPLAQQFRAVLAYKPKENAVKQELEKLAEHNKAVLRVSVSFNKAFAGGDESRAWKDYFEWVRREMPQMLKAAEEDLKRD